MGQFHWDPRSYLALMTREVPDYEVLQDETAAATRGVDAHTILELGTGTGETTRRVLREHPGARLHGIDSSPEMLDVARDALASFEVELSLRAIEDPLPPGPFDLVVSALAIHHLDDAGKRALFTRIAGVLRRGGRFVFADVVVTRSQADRAAHRRRA